MEGDILLCDYNDFTTETLPVTGGQITNYHSPLIDISGEHPVAVRVKSYKWTLAEQPVNHTPYIAQFDSDGVFVEGSRSEFILMPLNEEGKILDDTVLNDMSKIGIKDLPWQYGAGRVIEPAEGAKYAVIFNFREGAEVDLEISTYGKVKLSDYVEERLREIEETLHSNKVILFDSDTDGFVLNSVVGSTGNVQTATGRRHTPMIDISSGEVIVRVNSFDANGVVPEYGFPVWIAQYDENKAFIEGSRKYFDLRLMDGSETVTHDLADVEDAGVPASGVITPADGAKYAIIFNFYMGTRLDLEIFSGNEDGLVERVDQIERDVKLLKGSALDSSLHIYPELSGCADYVHPLAMDVAKAAKAHMGENELCIVLFTDTHYREGDTFNASRIAKHLAELTNAAAILHLGDLTDGLMDAKNVWLDLWQEGTVVLSGRIPYLQAVGNHDDGTLYNRRQGDLSASNYATSTEMFIGTTQNARRYINLGSKRGWYYLDDEDSKTRIIVLNSHDYPWEVDESGNLAHDNSTIKAAYSPEQLDWLANVAFDFSKKTDGNDWTAVVCGHGMGNRANVVYIMDNAKSGTKITTLPHSDQYNAYNYSGIVVTADYSVAHPKQVIMLRGDDHMDALNTSGNFPIVTFLNASLAQDQTSAPVKTAGTPTETCVSVLVFNNDTGTMREVRFGAGPSDPLTGYDNYRVIEYGSGYVKS